MFASAFFRNNICRYEGDSRCNPASIRQGLSATSQWSHRFSFEMLSDGGFQRNRAGDADHGKARRRHSRRLAGAARSVRHGISARDPGRRRILPGIFFSGLGKSAVRKNRKKPLQAARLNIKSIVAEYQWLAKKDQSFSKSIKQRRRDGFGRIRPSLDGCGDLTGNRKTLWRNG